MVHSVNARVGLLQNDIAVVSSTFSYSVYEDVWMRVASISSMLGSLFMIMTFVLFKPMRSFGSRMILVLAFCDFVSAFGFSFGRAFIDPFNLNGCIFQATIIHYALLASVMCTFVISVVLYEVSQGHFGIAKYEHFFYLFILVLF